MFFEDGKNLFLFSNKPKQDLYRSHFFTKKWDIFFTFMEGVFHGEGTAKEHVCIFYEPDIDCSTINIYMLYVCI